MKEIYDIFDEYAFNKMDNGLILFPLPTGMGKSSAVFEFIYRTLKYNKTTDKILFITSLKKNLQIDDLRKVFERENDIKLFNDKVLFLQSYQDLITENFLDIVKHNKIDKEISEQQVFIDLRKAVDDIAKLKSTDNEQLRGYINDLEDKLRKNYEPEFRNFIKNYINRKAYGKWPSDNITTKHKIAYVKEELPWLLKLYPQIMIDEKQVYVMSMNKFLVQTDTIVSGKFYNYKNLTKNAIIFIDEFDATKETVLNHLINEATDKNIDCITAFTTIRDKLNIGNINERCTTPSKKALEKKNGGRYISEWLETMKEKCKVLNDTYNLQYSFKNHYADLNQQIFLFQDSRNILVSNNHDGYSLYYVSNDETKENEIHIGDELPQSSFHFNDMVRQVWNFLNYFCKGVNLLALNLIEQKKEQNIEYTIDSAVRSILDIFFLDNKDYKNFFSSRILLYAKATEGSNTSYFDGSFYENGFTYLFIEDNDIHDYRSQILSTKLETTPEKILLEVCKKSRVFGLSATANFDSPICNYALSCYLIPKLNKHFYSLSKEEMDFLQHKFNQNNCHYDQVKINVNAIESKDKEVLDTSLEDTWEFEFGAIGKELHNKMEQMNCEEYVINRYFRLAKVFKEFSNTKDLRSLLCLFPLFPKNSDEFKCSFIEEMFDNITDDKLCFSKNVYILKSGFDYEKNKKDIVDNLSKCKKILVLSTYATIGAGQNLQYKIPSKLKIKNISDKPSSGEKDFDGIYLDSPTNLVTRLSEKSSKNDLLNYICNVKYLEEAGEFSTKDVRQYIESGIRVCLTNGKQYKYLCQIPTDLESYCIAATKTIVQAMGRICRTNMKNSNIYIMYDPAILNVLDTNVCNNNILTPEMLALLDNAKTINYKKSERDIILTKAIESSSNVIKKIKHYLQNINTGYWKDEQMKEWQEIRNFALQHPSLGEKEYRDCVDLYRPFYIELPSEQNSYWFKREGDYQILEDISCTKLKNYEEVSSESARLESMLLIPEVKDYFEKHDYAKSFTCSKYILNPPAFTNIYKGALGESAGRAILESNGIEIEEISNNELFELFDFKIPGTDIYIDFKHWSELNRVREWDVRTKILNKMKICKCKVVIVINILTEGDYSIKDDTFDGRRIIEIPSLCKENQPVISGNAIKQIKKVIGEYNHGTNA